jgi:hypothetical protein
MKNKKGTRGQTTIFIIIAVVIVAIILLFFLLREDVGPDIPTKPEEVPESFLDACLKEPIYDAIELIGEQGGYTNPVKSEVNYVPGFKYPGEEEYENIAYLCYRRGYYLPCQNTEGALFQHVEQEIRDHIEDDVDDCFHQLEQSLIKQGYTVESRYREKDFEVVLKEDSVVVEINAELTLTKSGETSREKGFKAIAPSKILGLTRIVQETMSQQAEHCEFRKQGYELTYPTKEGIPGWDIYEVKTPDSDTIYTIEHEETKERFRFAVSSCKGVGGLG